MKKTIPVKSKIFNEFVNFGNLFSSEQERRKFLELLAKMMKGDSGLEIEFENERDRNLAEAVNEICNPTNPMYREMMDYAKGVDGLSEHIGDDILSWLESVNDKIESGNPFDKEREFCEQLSSFSSQEIQEHFEEIVSAYNDLESVKRYRSEVDLPFYDKAFNGEIDLDFDKDMQMDDSDEVLSRNVLNDMKKELDRRAKQWEEEEKNKQQKNKQQGDEHKEGSESKGKGNGEGNGDGEGDGNGDILSRNMQKDMQKELSRREIEWELKQIEEARNSMLAEMYRKIEKVKELSGSLKMMGKNGGLLWDLAKGEFKESGFVVLEKYADLLSNDLGLKELAKMIGRHNDEEQKMRKELRSKVSFDNAYNVEPAYKGQINGLQVSDEISASLPAELALYSNFATRPIFKMKYAQKQLLSYSYVQKYEYKQTKEDFEEVDVAEKEEKGPMIICVDTSGSMQGVPERVAKTIAYALAQKAIEEERACYLISFSTEIETMDLSCLNSSDGLNVLVKFLKMSFNGGTDATPALVHSLSLLEENETWAKSDVLMISDFVMGRLHRSLVERIEQQKERKTRFFSFAITNSGNGEVVSAFDRNFIYDTSSCDAGAKLVRELYEFELSRA